LNKVIIIGNLTQDPSTRTVSTQSGDATVCSFTVAVNRRGGQEADFFTVSAWRALGENCQKYLAKGRKVAVEGTVSARAYKDRDGNARAQLEVQAANVEFLTPRSEGRSDSDDSGLTAPPTPPPSMVVNDDLPF